MSVTLTLPPLPSVVELTIVRGDDYKDTDGRALGFTSEDWPDLSTVEAITMTVRYGTNPNADGSLVFGVADLEAGRTVGAGEQVVKVELSAVETEGLTPGFAETMYDVQATMQSGSVITLCRGSVIVLRDATLPE